MKELFGALANPSRLQILELLRGGEKNVTQLVKATGLGQSLVSHYLKNLAAVGLVVSRTSGSFRVYALGKKSVEPLLREIEAYSATTTGQYKAQLAVMRARYDQLVEMSPFATLLFRDGRIVFANAAAVRILGAKSPADLLGRTVMDFVPPEIRPVALNYRQNLRRGRPMPLLRVRVKRLDGREFDAEVEGAPIPVGGDYEIQLVVRDVTERLAMESRLRESEARLRLIMAQTPAYVLVADCQFNCTYVNKLPPSTPRSGIVGHNILDLVVAKFRPAFRTALRQVLKTGVSRQLKLQGFGRATGVCWYDVRIGAIRQRGQVAELVVISTDISDRA